MPSQHELHSRAGALFSAPPDALPGIDFNIEHQLHTLQQLSLQREGQLYRPESTISAVRYHPANAMFGGGSASMLHLMLRHLAPKRIVEVGSGFSTAVMLDTSEHFFDGALGLTCIEPYPKRLRSLMRPGDLANTTIVECPLQDAPLDAFLALQAGDVLFVDSSHVLKTGSDLCTLLFKLLPLLADGVYIHFHDIYYPFEYPQTWVEQGRAWNESYALRLFLMHNNAYRLHFWCSYLYHAHPQALRQVPELNSNQSSLWLFKRSPAP